MTPEAFIAKWKISELKERSAAQSHFNDLCAMLGEPSPTEADPKGEWYAFEKGASKTTGGEGWADVWKRGHFGWEYKGKTKSLDKAFAQLQQYALALENPPLLVVCDLDRFRIHTNWTNTVSVKHEFALDDLKDPAIRQKLKWVLSDPEKLKPQKTRQKLTEEVAAQFAALAQRLRARGHDAETVAHFVNRLIFCMFAEDVKLLPNKLFTKMLKSTASQPEQFAKRASELFKAMKAGGEAAWETIDWFNGGLFDDDTALPLDKDDIAIAIGAAEKEWEEIDPSILGTLFERGLDPDKRSQLGAHYTDRDKIMLIIEPVIVRPWLAEWETTKAAIVAGLDKETAAKSPSAKTRANSEAKALLIGFLDRLRAFKVLDPACGSGNFLYLALLALKDLEHRVSIEAEALGFQREFPAIGPSSVKGIEINPYAAELARVSVWIGEIQWMLRNGFDVSRNPILQPLDNIECRDALLNPDGTEAEWSVADVVVGNPPFLGDRQHALRLGSEYTTRLRLAYSGRVLGRADLVVFWIQKAVELLIAKQIKAFGLVATKSIAKGASRKPLDQLSIDNSCSLYDAWTNEPWILSGASVRVAMICAALYTYYPRNLPVSLNNSPVPLINPDLTSGIDVTKSSRLVENHKIAFQGVKITGPFDLDGSDARAMLLMPNNPNGRKNSDVIARLFDIDDVVGRDSDRWVVDFGCGRTQSNAELYEKPFKIAVTKVLPFRCDSEKCRNTDVRLHLKFWEFERARPDMRNALSGLPHYIATPESSEHRIFIFVPPTVIVQGSIFAFARDDYTSFGILCSNIHECWSSAQGNKLGVGNQRRYNATLTFQTFPFPEGLTPNIAAVDYADDSRAIRIAAAAKRLNELREAWLNPADLVKRVPEVVPGYPDRILPVDDAAAATLKKRTLTNLYNERPTWLDNAHRDLDRAVAAAYGWPEDIGEEDALARLLDLNRERAAAGR